jgi:hypothetical protein
MSVWRCYILLRLIVKYAKKKKFIPTKMKEQTNKEQVYYGILNELSAIISDDCRQEIVSHIDKRMESLKDYVIDNSANTDKLRERYAILKTVKQLLS